ncbi:hypothetical protein NUW58_g9529 [Xylaria curta]|uniref:Uncharacterized protein n=1 Tax=Xylaria curta TaxID=42375 RepID=A0ACC1MVL4_9PEZI|nr:hypothetical protein NUW58_g9529 [Xylaria curta]
MPVFNLGTCARPNILALEPYRDYKDDGTNILLDANENAYGPSLTAAATAPAPSATSPGPEINFVGLHRYPDPHQRGAEAATLRSEKYSPSHGPNDHARQSLCWGWE